MSNLDGGQYSQTRLKEFTGCFLTNLPVLVQTKGKEVFRSLGYMNSW